MERSRYSKRRPRKSRRSRRSENMKDAELYLSTLGIPRRLPILRLTFNGFSIQPGLVMGRFKDALLHSHAPSIYVPSNCVLLCLDPDAPERNENGDKTGKFGPRL